MQTKFMNHAKYQQKLRTLDVSGLRFIVKDASEAASANPNNPNVGYYLDEVSYAGMELRRRGV